MRVSIPLITKTMSVLEEYDYTIVKRQLSKNYSNNDDIDLIIDELKKFIALKIFEKDYNCILLSPSYIIDEAWHSLILDPLSYCILCQKLSNNKTNPNEYIIGHNQHGSNDKNQMTRYNYTLKLYKEYFDSDPPEMIWPKNNTTTIINNITPNDRKRLRSSLSSSSSTSQLANNFSCQTDSDINDNYDDDDDILPYCSISLSWQQTDNKYNLNSDILKVISNSKSKSSNNNSNNTKEYTELFIKTHSECDYLIKVLPSTPVITIFELVTRLLNNIDINIKLKKVNTISINSICFKYNDTIFYVNDSFNLVTSTSSGTLGIDSACCMTCINDKICKEMNFENGSVLELRFVQLAC